MKEGKTDFVRHDPHDTQFWPLSNNSTWYRLRPGVSSKGSSLDPWGTPAVIRTI